MLQERNMTFKETQYEDFIILDKVKNIESLDLFKLGYFTIQDISASLTARAFRVSSLFSL